MFLFAQSCPDLIQQLIDRSDLIPLVAIGGGLTVGVVAIVFHAIQAMVIGRIRENTRREIAAYVAEGSIDPDKAIAMLEAGERREA